MIRVLSRKEINSDLWDLCIDNSLNAQIFGYSWYLDICCPGWIGIVKGNYEAVFPLASKNKLGIYYLYQPFFTRHFGVYSNLNLSGKERILFIENIPEKFKYWDFSINTLHKEIPENISSINKMYQQLDLNADYNLIKKNYHENLERNLKKAAKEVFSVNENYDFESVISQFKYHQKEKHLGFEENDFKTLTLLSREIKIRKELICHSVSDQGNKILAGAFFYQSNKRILYIKGFTTNKGKQTGAMHFLFDSLIKKQSNSNLILDFGGSTIESVARFYRSFGSADCIYLHLKLNRLPAILRMFKQ